MFGCLGYESTFSVNVAVTKESTNRELAKYMGANEYGSGYAPRKLMMPQQNLQLLTFHFDPAVAHRPVFRKSLVACAAV